MKNSINSSDDIIDVRDIIARLEELEDERDSFVIGAPDGEETPAPETWAKENEDDAEELEGLESLMLGMRGEGGDEQWRGDWYPLTLINEDYFEDAMRELVQDIGDLPKNIPNYLAIDWKRTAENLRVDYTSVEFDGSTFWYR